ncbi:hypothetical protein Tco_0252214 [Tanacetum coccineum]
MCRSRTGRPPESTTENPFFLRIGRVITENLLRILQYPKPLTLLTSKNKTYCVGENKDEAFRIQRKKLCNAPCVSTPLMTRPTFCGLFVMHRNRKVYWVLADVAGKVIAVITLTYKSLQYIFDQKDLNTRQRRWIDLLSDYEYEIKYHPGKANVVGRCLVEKKGSSQASTARKITISFLDLKTKIWKHRGSIQDLKAPAEWLRGLEKHFER